jgi:hypothetical protein
LQKQDDIFKHLKNSNFASAGAYQRFADNILIQKGCGFKAKKLPRAWERGL